MILNTYKVPRDIQLENKYKSVQVSYLVLLFTSGKYQFDIQIKCSILV